VIERTENGSQFYVGAFQTKKASSVVKLKPFGCLL
jgi:hypothetical protein